MFRGERKDEAAIEQALRWRGKALERERRQLGDRPSEAAAQAGELRPANARYLHIEATS